MAACNLYPSCVANDLREGDCCPDPSGKKLDCCSAGMSKQGDVDDYDASTAVCVIDAMQAAQMLGRAGTSMNGAIAVCRRGGSPGNRTESQKATCAAPVANVISSFTYAASFLSSAARECAESLHLGEVLEGLGFSPAWLRSHEQAAQMQAACSGAVTSFVAGLSQIAQSGATITETCPMPQNLGVRRRAQEVEAQDGGGASEETDIQATNVLGSKEEIQQQSEAECAFDVGQTTLFLAKAGTQINGAVKDCSDFALKEGGKRAKAACAVDVSGVIRSFGFVASLLSYSVSNCGWLNINLDAECSGAISDIITGIAGIAAASSAFRDTCQTIQNATRAIFGI